MSNFGFHQAMEEAGIEVAVTQVGDRYVIDEMRRRGWALGGEQSGHIIAIGLRRHRRRDRRGADDDARARRAPLADAAPMRKLPQTLVNVEVADRDAIAGAAAVWEAVEREGEGPRGPGPRAAAARPAPSPWSG